MKKILVLSLTVLLVLVIAVPSQAANIWEKRRQAVQEVKEGPAEPAMEEGVSEEVGEVTEGVGAELLTPEDITVPDAYGTVIEKHDGTNGKLIVHIQDAHANYEGQKNEAGILESLISDYDLNLILLEGGVGKVDLNYVKDRASLEERIEKGDKLLKEGHINGVEYLNIASDLAMTIEGIEDKGLYDINSEAMWEIDRFKDLAAEYVDRMIAAADELKAQIYSADLIELDNKKKDYDAEKIDLVTYYEYLYKKAEGSEIPLYTFPNFQDLVKASELEKKIDFAKITDGSATDEERKLYDEYMEATRNLNVNELFKEEPLLEKTLQDILATSSDQKKLIRISKALSIMKNLLVIKVVPEEYRYFNDNKPDFDPKFWADFLAAKSKELNLSLGIPENFYIISDNLSKVEKFYSTALERENAFLRKTGERMEKDNLKLAALVAGGFHTPTLTKLLSDAGYSYIVVSPKVTTETDDNVYRQMLKRDWLPEIK